MSNSPLRTAAMGAVALALAAGATYTSNALPTASDAESSVNGSSMPVGHYHRRRWADETAIDRASISYNPPSPDDM